MTKSDLIYDYVIVGGGAAGLQLALKMIAHPHFCDMKVAVIDRTPNESISKTWCYWEAGAGRWDHLIDHSWTKGLFYGKAGRMDFALDPYTYKQLNASTFVEYAKDEIIKSPICTWIEDEIKEVKEGSVVEIFGDRKHYRAQHVFDSRIDQAFYADKEHIKVWQHFLGWEIELERPYFDPRSFTMMDFRLRFEESTSFTYVLPISDQHALVEYTFFTPFLVEDGVYEEMLKQYLETYMGDIRYTIKRVEQGVIPMTDYPFAAHHQRAITKIGTAGGWVRPSSGYSFWRSGQYAEQIIQNIVARREISSGVAQNRWRWYDRLFLHILQNNNTSGPELFEAMYRYNDIGLLFRFLHEQTSIHEELKLLSSLPSKPFLNAWMSIWTNRMKR